MLLAQGKLTELNRRRARAPTSGCCPRDTPIRQVARLAYCQRTIVPLLASLRASSLSHQQPFNSFPLPTSRFPAFRAPIHAGVRMPEPAIAVASYAQAKLSPLVDLDLEQYPNLRAVMPTRPITDAADREVVVQRVRPVSGVWYHMIRTPPRIKFSRANVAVPIGLREHRNASGARQWSAALRHSGSWLGQPI
jgi:hypothetical protein